MMMGHLTFFWGTSTEILFPGWPGESFSCYILALIFVFMISLTVEWISHAKLIKSGTSNVASGTLRTLMYAFRIGLAYLVMLAVMSFNIGVLLAAVAGYSVGFLIFGSQVFRNNLKIEPYQDLSDLPPLNC
ncbi:hypothetical protein AB3S75_039128 [Citrus x aurantiifolia]